MATKVGIIGLGKMGILHAGIVNALPDARVAAVCEKERLLVRSAKTLLPEVTFYANHSRMIKQEDLDAVFITTPINSHVPLIIDIAAANPALNIFVEKPLAASYDLAKKACKATAKSNSTHMVGFQKRFSPTFQKAKEILHQKSLGQLMFFKAFSFSSDVLREGSSWRFKQESGGVLLDLAPHILDLSLWLFGEPKSVSSAKGHAYSSKVADYVHADLTYPSGFSGHIDVCWSMPKFRLPEIGIEIFGKQGSLFVSDDLLKFSEYHAGTDHTYSKPSFSTSVPYLLAEPEFTREDEAFLGHAENIPSFIEGAKVNKLIQQLMT